MTARDGAGAGGRGAGGSAERGGARGAGPDGRFAYRAHGLAIRSAFEIPEFLPADPAGEPDLDIVLDPMADELTRVAARIEGIDRGLPFAMAAPPPHAGGCFHVDEVGSFWVRGGREMRVAPLPGVDWRYLTLFVLGTGMGLVLFQRGAFVLHGASVAHGGRATLFLGPSGAGKSTIAAQLGRAGQPVLGDDTVALWPADGPGRFAVRPAGTSFKLWRDALAAAGLEAAAAGTVGGRMDKFYLENPHQAEERPHEVAEVMVLERAPPGEAPRIEALSPLEAVRAISENAYRPQFVDVFGGREAHFRSAAALAGRAEVVRLVRPWDHAATPAVVALLRARWEDASGGGAA